MLTTFDGTKKSHKFYMQPDHLHNLNVDHTNLIYRVIEKVQLHGHMSKTVNNSTEVIASPSAKLVLGY